MFENYFVISGYCIAKCKVILNQMFSAVATDQCIVLTASMHNC